MWTDTPICANFVRGLFMRKETNIPSKRVEAAGGTFRTKKKT